MNRRILERPRLGEIGLYRYLHIMLVIMRYVASRQELHERIGYEFHHELMVPILNVILCKLRAEGGEN